MPRASFVTVSPDAYDPHSLFKRKRVDKLLAVFKTAEDARSASLALLGCNVLQLYHQSNVVEISPSHPNYQRWFKMAKLNEAWIVDPLQGKGTGK